MQKVLESLTSGPIDRTPGLPGSDKKEVLAWGRCKTKQLVSSDGETVGSPKLKKDNHMLVIRLCIL